MEDSNQELRDKLQQAARQGGSAVLDVLSGMGMAIEKEPEPGVDIRMRYGSGTDEAFTTTMYSPAPKRPAGWPASVPFLPDVAGSVTLFDRPGRGVSVQWFKVPDPSLAVRIVLDECLATGWRLQPAPDAPLPASHGAQVVVLRQDEAERTISGVTVKGFGMVQVLERASGETCATG